MAVGGKGGGRRRVWYEVLCRIPGRYYQERGHDQCPSVAVSSPRFLKKSREIVCPNCKREVVHL